MNIADQLYYARKIHHYEIYTGAGDVYWTDTTHYKVECPTAKRWFLLASQVYRGVSSTLQGFIYNAADKIIAYLITELAASDYNGYPEESVSSGQYWILDAGEYVQLVFGTAQNATSFASCVVLEVDV